jgi:uncharacterized membrane-anchored protein
MNHDTLKLRYEKSYIAFLLQQKAVIFVSELRLENYDKHHTIINLLTEHTTDVLEPITIFSQHFIRMIKKELAMSVVPKSMVPDVSSKIGRIIDTINRPFPD